MRAPCLRSGALPRLAAVAGLILAAAACESAPKPSEPAAAATVAPVVEAPAEPPKPKGMPELLVDSMGPYLGQRVDLAQKDGAEKLSKVVRALPIDGKPVTLLADKKAKPSAVA